jgi:excisionase family DNA binding protein
MSEFPTGLRSAAEIAKTVGLSEDRILDLARAGYLPSYRLDGGPFQFRTSEVKAWIAENLVTRCSGSTLPDSIKVVIPAPPLVDRAPPSIMHIRNLQQLPKYGYQPGVYFLCQAEEVVYVGQSITPHARIGSHACDPTKIFDRVYLLPVPAGDLDKVEAAFIQHLQPRHNGRYYDRRNRPTKIVGGCLSEPAEQVIATLV